MAVTAHTQFSALADPTRRSIFETLSKGARSVGDLADDLPVSRPAVSQHLKVLSETGLVTAKREGTRRVYSVNPTGLEVMSKWLSSFWGDVMDHYTNAARKENRTMTSQPEPIPPVVKTRVVPIELGEAFDLFTRRIDTWWPLHNFSIGADVDGQSPASVRFEGQVGGRVVEINADGIERVWGDVIAWQPPYRFVLAWHPSIDPKAASILEVLFTAVEDGTEIYLEHRGWEEFGPEGSERRESYHSGWDVVLRPYEEKTGSLDAAATGT